MLSTLRAVLGASFGATRAIPITPPDPTVPTREDPAVNLASVDADAWTIALEVPAYSLDTHNLIAEVRAYLVPQGSGLPGSASDYVASSYPFASVDLRSNIDGANVVLPLPEVEPATYFGQLVILYDDAARVPPTPPSEDGPAPAPVDGVEPPTTG